MADEHRHASRKFLLTCGLILIATALRVTDKLTPELWAEVSTWSLAVYAGVNGLQWVGSYFADAMRKGSQ